MLLCLACGGVAGGLCFTIAVWRLNARYPDQVYRAAAVAAISAALTAALLLAWLFV